MVSYKPIVVFCICFLSLPFIQAAYFQPCYYSIDYSVNIHRVYVFPEPTSGGHDVSIRYMAYSEARIPEGRARVDTFLTSDSIRGAHSTNSHSFCSDAECPIERGDLFNAEFRLNIPWNDSGSLTLLMRMVDQVNGRELMCIVVNFEARHPHTVLTAN